MNGIVVTKLPDPAWGNPSVARVIPRNEDRWGLLRFLVGTDWEPMFPLIPDQILDQALRGYATPLMKILGPPPKAFVKRLPVDQVQCMNKKTCISYSPKCIPGPTVPDCWESAVFPEHRNVINNLVMLWREGIVVVVTVPEA